MPAKLHLPEKQIVDKWLSQVDATARTLATEYGCSATTISAILRKHLGADVIDATKRQKISVSTAARPDLKTEEHRARAKYASSCVSPEARKTQVAALLRGAEASANKRRGKKLTKSHRQKLSQSHIGIHSKEKHPNWRGGTSEICWRGTGWKKARKAARDRDNNTCQICGKTAQQQGRNMDVHHRISYFSFDSAEQANALENLVCLCRSCHRKVENGTILCP